MAVLLSYYGATGRTLHILIIVTVFDFVGKEEGSERKQGKLQCVSLRLMY